MRRRTTRRVLIWGPAALVLSGLCGCLSVHSDHFYALSVEPPGNPARVPPLLETNLKVSVPSLVDRSEMILRTSGDGISILEHERWASPLGDLLAQTLARDIERRRADVWVSAPGASQSSHATVQIVVDVVQLSVQLGVRAELEAQWRILDAKDGRELSGGESFAASTPPQKRADVAGAVSECVAALAGRIASQLPAPARE